MQFYFYATECRRNKAMIAKPKSVIRGFPNMGAYRPQSEILEVAV